MNLDPRIRRGLPALPAPDHATLTAPEQRPGWRRRLLPDAGTTAQVAARAALLWLMLRVTLAGLSAVLPDAAPANAPVTRILLVGVVVLLCAIDARASRESLFHANLGIGSRTTLGASAAAAALLELAVGWLPRLFGGGAA